MSPSRTRASGPPSSASGQTWIAAGTVPEAPLMRPSVTSATRCPRRWSTVSGGVSLWSSGMPLARGPWKRTTTTTSRSSSPAAKAACSASCESNTRAGACTRCRSSGTADTLITARPREPFSTRSPPVGENGWVAVRNTSGSALSAGRSSQTRQDSIGSVGPVGSAGTLDPSGPADACAGRAAAVRACPAAASPLRTGRIA